MPTQVQSIRGVGCKRGYPYFAYGVYQQHTCRNGKVVWSLVKSGRWFRSDKVGSLAFDGIPVVKGIRHNQPVQN